MSCGSGLTGLVLTAAGSMVTNGSLSQTFGAAPLSSLASAPLSLTDAATGLTNFAPTLNTTINGISGIVGAGSPLSGLPGTLSAIESAGFTSDMISAFNNIPTDLGSGGGLFDAIGGFAPNANSLLTTASGGADILNNSLGFATEWAGKTIGGDGNLVGNVLAGDPKKFGTILNTASSYVTSANQMINGALNSDTLGTTFTGMNNIVSGGLSGINLDFGGFSEEIAKAGSAIDLTNLDGIGSPGQLVKNISAQGSLGPLYSKISNISIDAATASTLGVIVEASDMLTVGEIGVDINTVVQQGATLSPAVQKEIYNVLDNLDESDVAQIKSILNVTQDSIKKGSDLLDPAKLFPNSHATLTSPLRTASVGYRSIYVDNASSVNPEFNNLGQSLRGIVPDDVAIANGALSRSLQQVKNISQSNTSDLSTALAEMETLKDLSLLEDQSTYLNDDVRNYWLEAYGVDSDNNIPLATGNNGQLKISDVIGFAAGYNSAAPITKNSQILAEMASAGELDIITGSKGVYDTIQKFCNGDFGPNNINPGEWEVEITSGYVGEGTYPSLGPAATSEEAFEDAWLNGIIPAIKSVLSSYTANDKAKEIMTNSERWNEQLAREYQNQTRIDNADLASVRASDDVALNLALKLPDLGTDTAEGGAAEILERIVDFSSVGGQSIIASMREGRNLKRLADANIQQDAFVDVEGLQNPGSLTDSRYTGSQAKSNIIKN